MAVQDVPLPDSNTQKTEPPVVTPVQAEPVRASNMLLPINGQKTTAKLIVTQPKQATSNPPADGPQNPPTNPTTSRATISQLPSDRQAQVTNVKILPISPRPKGVSADQQPPSKSVGRLTLLPMIPVNDKPSSSANVRKTAADLEIPLHVLYPNRTSPTVQQDKTSDRQPIVLQSKTVRPKTSGTGQLQIIKNEVEPAQKLHAEPAQSMTLQPIVLQSKTDQPKKQTAGTGQLQIIKNKVEPIPTVQAEPAQNMALQPIVLQSKTDQPKRQTAGTGQLQIIKNKVEPAPMAQAGPAQSTALQPIVLQSKSDQPTKQTPVVPNQVVQAEPVQPVVVPNKVVQAEPVQPAVVQNNAVQAEPVQPVVIPNKVVQAEPVQAAVVQNEVVQTEMIQPAVVQNNAVQAEPVQPVVVPNKVVQAEPVQPAVAPKEVVQADAVQPAVVQNEVVQVEMIQPVVAQNEATQAETVRPAVVQPQVVQPAGVQFNVADRGPTRLEMKPANSPANHSPEKPQHVPTVDIPTAKVETAKVETPVSKTTAPSEPVASAGGVSAAGIPFYPAKTDEPTPPQNPEFPRGKELDQVLSQNVGNGNPMPGSSSGRSGFQGPANLISSSNDSWILNKGLQDEQNPNRESVVETDPSIAPQQASPGTGDYFLDENATFNNALKGCGNPDCIGCFGGDEAAIAKQMDYCGSMLCARRYYIFDTLSMTRDNGGVAGSNFFSVGTDSNYGMRVTLGHRRDAAEGTEISYWGVRTLTGSQERTDSLNRLRATFTPGGGFTEFTPETFNFYAADWQAQQMSTEFQSFEYNRTKWAWDVFKSFYGIRYIYFDDDYLLASRRGFPGNTSVGVFTLDSSNNLFGPQIGTEYFYDVGYRVSFSLLTKVGVHVNFSELNTSLKNIDYSAAPPAETFFLNQRADKTKVAGTLELGFQTHYQVAPQSRFRFGYNALWLWGVITAEDNYPVTLTPFTGTDPKTNRSAVLLQGINFGLEFYR